MVLTALDYIIIAAYILLVLAVGLYFRKRASKSLTDYFISGRSLPWWILGTSMVATTFAADTPLAVTNLTAQGGLAQNWLWWNMAIGGMITVFVYARLWRRSGVVTDVELIEKRYSGKPASLLRGFRAIYLALPVNCIIIGWVAGAMLTILNNTVLYGTGYEGQLDWWIIVGLLLIAGTYTTLSGLWGVATTDVLQFCIAMGACIVLAVIAVGDAGGIVAMRESVDEAMGPGGFRFFPDFANGDLAQLGLNLFLIYIFVQWWASWYPGAEPGGGGYVVQRMASAKNEKHALLGTLWFQVAHYCVRPWPWLLVAFAAIAKYPELMDETNRGVGFAWIMRDLLPPGLIGLLLIAFFAAFMSTLASQTTWGASLLVNDVYKRFINPEAEGRTLAHAGRVATLIMLTAGGLTAYAMRHVAVDEAWRILLALGAGTGAVFMLRWFWWRINAWSEITAMVSAGVYYVFFTIYANVTGWELVEEYKLFFVAMLTTLSWITVTFLTQPEKQEVLESFLRTVRPGGAGWKAVAAKAGIEPGESNLGLSLSCAALGIALVYLTLPGVGFLIFGEWIKALACLGGAAICAGGIVVLLNRIGWEKVMR